LKDSLVIFGDINTRYYLLYGSLSTPMYKETTAWIWPVPWLQNLISLK